MKKNMARFVALASVTVMIMSVFAGCAASKPKVETAGQLYDEYMKSEGLTNNKMHSVVSISLDIETGDDTTLNFPMVTVRDEQIAGDLKHMTMSMNYTGSTAEETGEANIEAYRTSEGNYMQLEDGTWCLANQYYLFESDDGFIRKDVFSKGDIMVTDAGDVKSYTVSIPMSAYTDSITLQDMFYDIGLSDMVDTVELTKALMESSIVYTFDEHYNLTGIHCDPVESYAVYTEETEDGTQSYNAKISYSINYTFFDFGKVTDAEVTMPDSSIIVTPEMDVEEPEAIDAAPSGADLPENP